MWWGNSICICSSVCSAIQKFLELTGRVLPVESNIKTFRNGGEFIMFHMI